MNDINITAEAIAYAIARLMIKEESAFNYKDVCEQIFGPSFCNYERAKKIVKFLRNALAKGYLKKAESPADSSITGGVQHYQLHKTIPHEVSEASLAMLDPLDATDHEFE